MQEAVEGTDQLRRAGIAVGPVVANMVATPRVSTDELAAVQAAGADALAATATATGHELSDAAAAEAIELAAAHTERLALQQELRADLRRRTGLPLLELPLLARPRFGADELELLADLLGDQAGVAGTRLGEVPAWAARHDGGAA